MNDGAWERLSDAVDARFGIDNFKKRTEPLPDKPELKQDIVELYFERDGDQYRLTRTTHAAILERKPIYSKTSNATGYHTTYDPNEVQHSVKLEKKQADDWVEQDVNELAA